jgi:CheY-like chemotaxis protein
MNETLQPTILLVEDNDDDVFAMRRALKLAQVANPLQVVTDGKQALDYLSGQGPYHNRKDYPLPFIVFLDLKLPFVHGFEVLSWIKHQAALEAVIVVVLTSSDEPRDHERAYTLGARSYLVKPPTAQHLTDLLKNLESFWALRTSSMPVAWSSQQCDSSSQN